MRLVLVMLVALISWGCFLKPSEPEQAGRVALANRLYLNGDWEWADTMTYAGYVPAGDSAAHHGIYIVSGTASLEVLDSADVESYVLVATSQVEHADSVADAEFTRWIIEAIEFEDTVRVENDSIFGLEVEPIPREANATTNGVRWTLDASQLWCTNWLTDSLPAGNRDDCRTVVNWRRVDGGVIDTTGS